MSSAGNVLGAVTLLLLLAALGALTSEAQTEPPQDAEAQKQELEKRLRELQAKLERETERLHGVGPLGLKSGMTRAALEQAAGEVNQVADYLFIARAVPEPLRGFDSYNLIVSPEVGLCRILTTSESITSDSAGSQLKDRFWGLKKEYTAAYGYGEVTDWLNPLAARQEPEEWMQSLTRKNRRLSVRWTTGISVLKHNLVGIELDALATDSTTGVLRLEFIFSNALLDQECLSY